MLRVAADSRNREKEIFRIAATGLINEFYSTGNVLKGRNQGMWLNEYASQTAERLVRCERESELKERLAFIEQCLGSKMPASALEDFWRKVLGRYSREARQVLRESVTMGSFGELVVTAEELLGEKLRTLSTRAAMCSSLKSGSAMTSSTMAPASMAS